MSVSEAEKRREARRQRILNNQESRINRILGADSSHHSDNDIPRGIPTTTDSPDIRRSSTSRTSYSDDFDDFDELSSTAFLAGAEKFLIRDAAGTTASSAQKSPFVAPPTLSDLSRAGSGPQQQQEVPVSRRIAIKQHHLILCLLSLVLSVFGGEGTYLLLYLFIYEATFFVVNGFTLPPFYSSKNTLFTLMALFGVPETYRKRLGEAALVLNWITTDLTIIIASALVPVFLLYLAQPTTI